MSPSLSQFPKLVRTVTRGASVALAVGVAACVGGTTATVPTVRATPVVAALDTCGRAATQVMLLGTFPGEEDLFGTVPPSVLALRSASRQAEIAQVVSRLAAWRPAKVAVLGSRTDSLSRLYAQRQSGAPIPEASLAAQIGVGVATTLGHRQVFAVGTVPPPAADSLEALSLRREEHMQRAEGRSLRAQQVAEELLVQRARLSVQEHLQIVNSEPDASRAERFLTDAYLGAGEGTNYGGADHLARVFGESVRVAHDLLRLRDGRAERLLLVVPARHLPALRRTLFAASEVCPLSAVTLLDR